MMNRILRLVNIQIKTYANWRGGVIKNGGSIATILGYPVCDIYAVVNDDGGAVYVLRKGIMASLLADDMKHDLMDYFYSQDEDKRYFYWNEIDSIYH